MSAKKDDDYEPSDHDGDLVLFTPPHHSDFQPIELLWAKLKGNIGRKYDSKTTMTVLKERLDDEFAAARDWQDNIGGMIRKAARIARQFWIDVSNETDDVDAISVSGSDGETSEDESLDDGQDADADDDTATAEAATAV